MMKKIFHMTTMLIMRKNDNEILSHDDNNHEEDDKTQQTQKLYVLHVMIEKTTTTSTTDPKIICSAVHLSKICTKNANSTKYIPPKYICKLASKQQQKRKD